MTEWATAEDFRTWSTYSKVKDLDGGTLTRALKRARLNIQSLLRRTDEVTVTEKVQEALFIVAENIVLGRDEAVAAARARGLQSANYGEHSIAFGQTQNPFITPEVIALLEEETEKYPWQTLQTDKMVIPGQTTYVEDDEDIDYTADATLPYRGPYPYIL